MSRYPDFIKAQNVFLIDLISSHLISFLLLPSPFSLLLFSDLSGFHYARFVAHGHGFLRCYIAATPPRGALATEPDVGLRDPTVQVTAVYEDLACGYSCGE